jgi:hypothetical protein
MTAGMQDVQVRIGFWFYELEAICSIENPWGFLCLSALIDYLARLANGCNRGRTGYIDFIRNHFPDKYRNFKYRSGQQDLPEQMYHVLRCGLVHSFSLIPDQSARSKVGRDRSIVLIHECAAKERGLAHLDPYVGPHGRLDAALFVAERFLDDTKTAADALIQKALPGSTLEANILTWFHDYPPIKSGF